MVICVYSLESPQWGDSDENKQHTVMMKKIEKNIPIMLLDLAQWLILNSSNYPCLEHNFMDPKMFEPLKFYCIPYSKHTFWLWTANILYSAQRNNILTPWVWRWPPLWKGPPLYMDNRGTCRMDGWIGSRSFRARRFIIVSFLTFITILKSYACNWLLV